MKTQQSFMTQKLFAASFADVEKVMGAKGFEVDPKQQEAAFKAWMTRGRRQLADLKQKVAAHREAGEETLARKAENEHRKLERAVAERVARRGGAPPAPKAPSVRPAPAPRPPASHHGSGEPRPAPVDAVPLRHIPSDRLRAAMAAEPPKPAPAPAGAQLAVLGVVGQNVTQWNGHDDEIKAKYKEERDKLIAQGFKQVELTPADPGKTGKEVLAHKDGRKVEFQVNRPLDQQNGRGHISMIEHPAPPKPPREVKPRKPRAKVDKFEGEAHELEAHAKAEGDRLKAEGFKRVEVDPISVTPDANGNVSGGEVLQHPDGRKVEINVEFNHNDGKGKVEIKQHAAPPAPPPLAPGVQKNPMKAVSNNAAVMRDAGSNKALIERHEILGGGDGGIGETHFVWFKDGTRAIYKPEKGTGLYKYEKRGNPVRQEMPSSIPEHARELAMFKISEAAGFNVVPHVEVTDYDIGTKGGGHAMAFVDGKIAAQTNWEDDARSNHPDLHRIAALDLICANTDRHGKNFMKGKADGRWYAIDNGLSFPNNSHHHAIYNFQVARTMANKPIPDEVKKEILSIRPEHVRAAMEGSKFKEIDIKGALGRLRAVQEAATAGTWPRSTSEVLDKAKRYAAAA